MRKCSSCKDYKAVTEFNKHSSRADGLQTLCKECNRQKSRDYYAKNVEKHRKDVGDRKRRWVAEAVEKIQKVKQLYGCSLCSESDPCCLDFHHLGDKKDAVSVLAQHGYSWETIVEEIKKCLLLCANCHRKVHAGRLSIDGVVADWNAAGF